MFVNLIRSDDKEIVYTRSKAARNAIILILLALDAISYMYFAEQIRQTPVGENEYVWAIPVLFILVLNFLALQYAGPDDLTLDIDRQAYVHIQGYPMFPRITTGSFGDFYGLCVRPVKNARGTVSRYRVELDWNTPDFRPLVLFESLHQHEAQEQLRLLARRLVSIPISKD